LNFGRNEEITREPKNKSKEGIGEHSAKVIYDTSDQAARVVSMGNWQRHGDGATHAEAVETSDKTHQKSHGYNLFDSH
jgi:hypothetical protein